MQKLVEACLVGGLCQLVLEDMQPASTGKGVQVELSWVQLRAMYSK